MREYALFNDLAPDSGVTGLQRITSAPRTTQSFADTATTVGFCHPRTVRTQCSSSAESSSQSTMTRSVLPSARWASAFEELKQILVAVEQLVHDANDPGIS